MSELNKNPVGLDGFEFIEFCSHTPQKVENVFSILGFTKIANHRTKDVSLWRQGDINLILNNEPKSPSWFFAQEHGDAACGMGFRVKDARHAYDYLLDKGAEPVDLPAGPMELKLPGIRGIGGAIIYLIDRYQEGLSLYDIDFEYIDDIDIYPKGLGLKFIDHLTHNVYGGRMKYWADYYAKLFNFFEMRFFDIKGEYSGLTSKALSAPDGKIKIPLNEEGLKGNGQIDEYLREFNGEGIQHIAFACHDLYKCIDLLKENKVPLMTPPPDTYYQMLDDRLPNHNENVDELKLRGILLDGANEGKKTRLLLQIFSEPLLGPVFFEFIERKGDEGFGEGNFKALFESIERDQVKRGVINTEG